MASFNSLSNEILCLILEDVIPTCWDRWREKWHTMVSLRLVSRKFDIFASRELLKKMDRFCNAKLEMGMEGMAWLLMTKIARGEKHWTTALMPARNTQLAIHAYYEAHPEEVVPANAALYLRAACETMVARHGDGWVSDVLRMYVDENGEDHDPANDFYYSEGEEYDEDDEDEEEDEEEDENENEDENEEENEDESKDEHMDKDDEDEAEGEGNNEGEDHNDEKNDENEENPEKTEMKKLIEHAFVVAAHLGDVQLLGKMLEAGADPNARDEVYGYPLYAAAVGGREASVRMLLEAGARVDDGDGAWGGSPLEAAVKQGQVEMVRLLLDHDAKVGYGFTDAVEQKQSAIVRLLLSEPQYRDRVDVNEVREDEYGIRSNTPNPIVTLALRNDLDLLDLLLDHPGLSLAEKEGVRVDRKSLLMWAVQTSRRLLVQKLMRHPSNVAAVAANLEEYRAQLFNLCHHGDLGLVKDMLTWPGLGGDNVNALCRDRYSMLSHAIAGRELALGRRLIHVDPNANADDVKADPDGVIDLLLQHPDIDVTAADHPSLTPLVCAANNGNVAVVKKLLQKCPAASWPKEVRDEAFLRAISNGHKDIVELLRNSDPSGGDISVADPASYNALHLAVLMGRIAGVELALSLGIDVNSRKPDDRTSLISAAASDGSRPDVIVKRLLACDDIDVNAIDTRGNNLGTALAYAASPEVVSLLLADPRVDPNKTPEDDPDVTMDPTFSLTSTETDRFYKVDGIFIAPEPSMAARNRCETPLIAAARFARATSLEALLDSDAVDVDRTDGYGRTALWWAAFRIKYGPVTRVIGKLCSRIADPNIPDCRSWTPLAIAAFIGNYLAIDHLLRHKNIDPNRTNNDGMTALHIAIMGRHDQAVEYLLRHPAIDVDGPLAFSRELNRTWYSQLLSDHKEKMASESRKEE